jgi:predicted secreted protein
MKSSSMLAWSLLSLSALTLGAGCTSEVDAGEEDTEVSEDEVTARKAVRLTEDDDGSTFNVVQGQSVVIKLGSNASTGFAWKVKSTTRALGQPTIRVAAPRADGPVGSGGSTTLTWRTNSPLDLTGTHKIELVYQRGSGAPARTFSVVLRVSRVALGGAGEGEACGGVAGAGCKQGLTCLYSAEGPSVGTCRAPKACRRTGCGGDVCADRNLITTCQVRPESQCTQGATCEQQADGNCGFTLTRLQQACIDRLR